jgi:hypothetical protein
MQQYENSNDNYLYGLLKKDFNLQNGSGMKIHGHNFLKISNKFVMGYYYIFYYYYAYFNNFHLISDCCHIHCEITVS